MLELRAGFGVGVITALARLGGHAVGLLASNPRYLGGAIDGDAASWLGGFLSNRCLTIAGGTSEVQRNVIAERVLGLPRK